MYAYPDQNGIYARDPQAKAAYDQFTIEPHPEGFNETYPAWENLSDGHKQLWYRVATAVLNAKL